MNLTQITPLVITLNEEANIGRTLAALDWAIRIVAVDSGSSDGTLDILAANPRVHVFRREFDNFAAQCEFGRAHVETPFTLSLDADHVVSTELVSEIGALDPGVNAGWAAPFVYRVGGRALRGSLLPPRVVLFRTAGARFVKDGHAHHVEPAGPSGMLRSAIFHDDRKPIERWYEAQRRYLAQEATKLSSTPWNLLSWPDRMRRLFLGPLLVVPYCLVVKGLLLDGTAGLYYTYQRLYAEALLALLLVRSKD
jgi:glycosyltransferase involved in cell wall biosynthesis